MKVVHVAGRRVSAHEVRLSNVALMDGEGEKMSHDGLTYSVTMALQWFGNRHMMVPLSALQTAACNAEKGTVTL